MENVKPFLGVRHNTDESVFDESWKITPDGKINWYDLGFLRDMEYDKQIALGKAFNKLYSYLLKVKDEDSIAMRIRQGNRLTCLWPTIRKVFERIPTDKCVLKSPKKFVLFFLDYFDEYYPVISQRKDVDAEAQTCLNISQIVIRTIMNNE